MDGGKKALTDKDEALNITLETGRANLKDDGTASSDGKVEESVRAASFEQEQSLKRKPRQTVYKSSIRKRNNEKSRRIQCNEAMDQLLELIIKVQQSSSKTGLEGILNHSNVAMITNRGELIERATDVMRSLMKANKAQKARIEELERALTSRSNLLARASASGMGEQSFVPQLHNQVVVPANLRHTSQHAASEAIISNLTTQYLNNISPEALHAAALLQRRGGLPGHPAFGFLPPQPGHDLLSSPHVASLLLGQDLRTNQDLLYQAMGPPMLPQPTFSAANNAARVGINTNVASIDVNVKSERSSEKSP